MLAAFSATAAPSSFVPEPPEEDTGTGAIELGDTVVRPDYVEIERLQNTKEILVVTRDQIEASGNRTVSDVLSQIPSVNVNTTGRNAIDGRGQGSETASRNLQVIIDGAPITTITSHPFSMNYNVIPVEQLERVEVIPGGGSVMYGSGAAGGVVSMTSSLRTLKTPKSTLSGEWNSDGYRLGATAGTTFAGNRGAVEFALSKTDRDLVFKDTYANMNYASFGLRFDATPTQQFILRASRMREDSQLVNNVSKYKLEREGRDFVPEPVRVTVGTDARGKPVREYRPGYIRADQQMDMVSLSWRAEAGDSLSFVNDAFYYEGSYQGDTYDNHAMDIKGYGLRSKTNWRYAPWGELLVGVDLLHKYANLDYESIEYVSGKYLPVLFDFTYETDTYALYALNTNRWGKWEVNAGARYELTDWSFSKLGKVSEALGTDETRRRNAAFELSAAYHYRDTGRVYARYERGYTLPDGILVSDQNSYRVNGKKVKRLEATQADDETYDLFELGWREVFPWSTVSATLWASQTDNQMSRYYLFNDDGLSMRTVNLLNTRRWGADLTLSQKLGPVTLEESIAYTMGRTKCADAEKCAQLKQKDNYTDKGLKKVPKYRATLRATWDVTDRLQASAAWLYYGRYVNFIRTTDDVDGAFMKSYSLTNLRLKYRHNDHFEAYAGVTNLFDKTYYEYGGDDVGSSQTVVLGNARTFFVGMRATW